MNGSVTHLDGGPFRVMLFLSPGQEYPRGRQAHCPLGDDCLQAFYRLFVRSSANVSGAVIVIVGEDSAHLAVMDDARGPVVLISALFAVVLCSHQSRLFL